MKKKILALGLTMSLALSFVVPNAASAANYVRKNSFINAKGAERVAEIKRFQAMNNLAVTGGLNNSTSEVLYNEDMIAYDIVKNPPTTDYWITVNKSKRILTVYKGSKVASKFPVALGTSKTPTPSGKAKIGSKLVNPAWGGMGGKYTPRSANDPLNPLGERWMGLVLSGYNGYGIHGTIKPHEIGTYASNGCIRLFNYDVENYVFPKIKVGTPVWMGSDAQLNSWGVYQYVEKGEAPAPAKPVTPKPAEPKPAEPKPIEKPAPQEPEVIGVPLF